MLNEIESDFALAMRLTSESKVVGDIVVVLSKRQIEDNFLSIKEYVPNFNCAADLIRALAVGDMVVGGGFKLVLDEKYLNAQ